MSLTATTAVSIRRVRLGMPWWRQDPLLATALFMCGVLVVLATAGPLLAPYDPNSTDILSTSLPPSAAHLFGTDTLGRDVLSRILFGARLSFLGPLIIVTISTVAGTAIALAAAWTGGWFDALTNKVLNVMFAIPGILVAVVVVATFGSGFWAPVLALSLAYTPFVARVVKSAATQERRRAYIEAYQLAGISSTQIVLRHMLRNLQPLILAQATLNFGASLIDFGALSYLGFGIPQPTAEWGAMIAAGRPELLEGNMYQSVAAGTMIIVTVVAFNVLGERLSRRMGAFS